MKIALIILVDAKNRILLQQRTDDAPSDPGLWGLFGGHCDEGERPEDAVIREGLEELGIELRSPKLLHVWEFTDVNPPRKGTRYYYCQRWESKSEIRVQEGQGWGWFSPDEVRALPLANYAGPILELSSIAQLDQ